MNFCGNQESIILLCMIHYIVTLFCIRYQLNLMVAKIYVVSFIYVHMMHINDYDYIDYLDQYTILVEIFQM